MRMRPKKIRLKELFGSLGIKPVNFIIPILLSLAASLFEGISMGALVPMLNGIINMDFDFVKELFVFKAAADVLPKLSGISSTHIFILLLSVIFSAAVLKNILQYVSMTMISYQVRKASNITRRNIFEHYLNFGKMFFDRNNLGYLYNVLVNYTSMITAQIKNIRFLLNELFMLSIYLIIMFVISWRLTLIICVLFPPLNYISKWFIKRIKKVSMSYEVSLGEISKKISNILSCMSLVKLYAYEKKEYKHFSFMSEEIQKVEFSLDRKSNLIRPMQEIFFLSAILLLVSAIAFIFVKQKSGEIAGFLVFFFILRRAQNSFLTFGSITASLATVGGPIKAISKMLDKEGKFIVTDGKKEFTGLKNDIKFKHLSFAYLKENPILKDISFSIGKGEITAIVGPTGVGKTTLINLILRFYDCPPSTIMIDGDDIRDFTFNSLRVHMALVSQDTLLFNDTIKNNMIYGLDREVSGRELTDVIKKARLCDFIASLKDGLDTYVGDKGVILSGGEKQRVSIARALLKGSEILILDEATSSLDTKTERLIQEAINEAVKDRTAIVIAHRLSTIKNADKIVFIDGGRVMEEGALDELLRKKGRFYEAWQEQKFY